MEIETEEVKINKGTVTYENGIQIIDYSERAKLLKEQPNRIQTIHDVSKDFHMRFNYGEDGDYTKGGHLEFKFKDPRDALNYLVKHFDLVYGLTTEINKLFEYIQYGVVYGNYSQLETYYLIILEFKIEFVGNFKSVNPLPKKELEEYTQEELVNYKTTMDNFVELLDQTTRLAHRFAVANTWTIWNRDQKYHNNAVANNYKDRDENLFGKYYQWKEISHALNFNLYRRLWQVYFKDGSWIICGDHGNGWYQPLTDFNSLKFIEITPKMLKEIKELNGLTPKLEFID